MGGGRVIVVGGDGWLECDGEDLHGEVELGHRARQPIDLVSAIVD